MKKADMYTKRSLRIEFDYPLQHNIIFFLFVSGKRIFFLIYGKHLLIVIPEIPTGII